MRNIYPTEYKVQSDVTEVEKLLRIKNKLLSKLESRERLFRRMIKNGVSTPDVDGFVSGQTTLKKSNKLI